MGPPVLAMAGLVAGWSKDRSTQVGCVIVSWDHAILSVGYNGFPRDIDDEVEERHLRPAKYKWTEHAERNAIYNAVLHQVDLRGSTMYLTWYPCADCARGIIQSGINGKRPDDSNPAFIEDFKIVPVMLHEAEVRVRFLEENPT